VVRNAKGVEHFARVKVPSTLPQLVPVVLRAEGAAENAEPAQGFIWLEQLIMANLESLFPGLEIVEAHPFHVTRDAEVTIQELEGDDLLETIEEAVWRRRFRAVVRLQVDATVSPRILDILT
jgi:polyphosphate kinase